MKDKDQKGQILFTKQIGGGGGAAPMPSRPMPPPSTMPRQDVVRGRTASLMGGYGAPMTENGINDPRTRTHIPSVSEMKDPALNHRAFPGAPMNVTDAINSGAQVQGWGNNSGVGPGTEGYRGSDTDGDQIPDGHIDAHIYGDTMAKTNRGAAPYNPLGYPQRADGGPVKRASGGKVNSSIQPMRGLKKFYDDNPLEATAYQRECTRVLMNSKLRMPGNLREETMPPPQTMPRRREGGEVRGHHAPTSRAGRTAGLSQHYNNQRNLALERGARGSVDPITGLSHTPTQREINDLLASLAEKPTEFPGFGGLEESLLLSDYYNAKQAGDQQGLRDAMAAVVDYKNRLAALREQKRQQKYIVNEDGPEAYQPEGGEPELIPGGEHVQSFPEDGKVIPAGRTAQLAAKGALAPPSPEISRAAQASEKVAPPIPKTEPSAMPGRTSQMMEDRSISTPYGSGSVTHGPRRTPSHINMSDTYDPSFAQKGEALDAASRFSAVEQPPPSTAEGSDFAAVVETPQQAWQKQAGRTVDLMEESKARKAKDAERDAADAAMAGGKFTSRGGFFNPLAGAGKLVSRLASSLAPSGAFGR